VFAVKAFLFFYILIPTRHSEAFQASSHLISNHQAHLHVILRSFQCTVDALQRKQILLPLSFPPHLSVLSLTGPHNEMYLWSTYLVRRDDSFNDNSAVARNTPLH
jgi:hypothetical protein